jgi:protein AATF/BFR2
MEKNTNASLPFLSETIERWNTRNSNLHHLLNKGGSKGKAFNQGIVQQVE